MINYIPRFDPFTGQMQIVTDLRIAQTITCGKNGCLYTKITDAIAAITDASPTKPYIILTYPGDPYTDDIDIPPYITVSGVVSGPNAPVITGKITSNFSGAGEQAAFSRVVIARTVASDGEVCVDCVGTVYFYDVFMAITNTNNYGFIGMRLNNTTATGALILANMIINSTYDGSTKNMIGVYVDGDEDFSMALSTIEMNTKASSGNIIARQVNSTGQLSLISNNSKLSNTKAASTYNAYGSYVSSASTETRISQSEEVRLQSTTGGVGYGAYLDSSGHSAEMFYVTPVTFIDGFTTYYSESTATGDTHKIWSSSTNKLLPKTGSGLAVALPQDLIQSGFSGWSTVGATYWSYDTGTKIFTVNKRGIGAVHSVPIVFATGQSVTCMDRTVNVVYVDSVGGLRVSPSLTDTLYLEDFVLFAVFVQGTNYIVVRADHPLEFTAKVGTVWRRVFQALLESASQTMAVVNSANRTVSITGDNAIIDRGIRSTFTTTSPITWIQMVQNTSLGLPAIRTVSSSLATYKSGAGDTGVLVNNGRFLIFRLGVLKDTLNSSAVQFVSFADSTDYANLAAATNAIAAGNVIAFPTELQTVNICQLGYAIVNADGAGAGTMPTAAYIVPEFQVFGASFVGGGASTSAGLITTSITNFNRVLTPSETTVQAALDRIDDYAAKFEVGDIDMAAFNAADTATDANVTGLAFANATVRAFRACVSISISATTPLYEVVYLYGIQRAATWALATTSAGDDTGVTFDITAAGQVTYTVAAHAGWTATKMEFRAWSLSV